MYFLSVPQPQRELRIALKRYTPKDTQTAKDELKLLLNKGAKIDEHRILLRTVKAHH